MPATNLKIGTFVLIPNFITQKGISKKLQPLRKGPYQIIDKPTEVTYKLNFEHSQITQKEFDKLAELLLKFPTVYATSKFDVGKIRSPLH